MNLIGTEARGGIPFQEIGISLRSIFETPQAGVVFRARQDAFEDSDRIPPGRIYLIAHYLFGLSV